MDLWQLKLGKQNAASDSRIKMALVLVWWVVVALGEVSVLAEVTEEEEMGLIDRVTGISSVTPVKPQTRFALIVTSVGVGKAIIGGENAPETPPIWKTPRR